MLNIDDERASFQKKVEMVCLNAGKRGCVY